MQFIRQYQIPDTGLCDRLLECFRRSAVLGAVRPGLTGGATEPRPELKRSFDMPLVRMPEELVPEYKPDVDAWFACLRAFLDDYVGHFPHLVRGAARFGIVESPNFQHYPPGGGFFAEHFENGGGPMVKRVLVFQTWLNDIRRGGGTRFVYQRHVVEPARGRTVIWPAGFTHVHAGVVAPEEDKLILTGWLSYE